MLRFQLVEVGRDHCNATVEVESLDQLPDAVRKRARLMSRAVEIHWDNEHLTGDVVVGGFRPVGKVHSIDIPSDLRAAGAPSL